MKLIHFPLQTFLLWFNNVAVSQAKIFQLLKVYIPVNLEEKFESVFASQSVILMEG